jgi:hypothetical protein
MTDGEQTDDTGKSCFLLYLRRSAATMTIVSLIAANRAITTIATAWLNFGWPSAA